MTEKLIMIMGAIAMIIILVYATSAEKVAVMLAILPITYLLIAERRNKKSAHTPD